MQIKINGSGSAFAEPLFHGFLIPVHTSIGDDMQNSLWASKTKLPQFPALDQDLHVDVLVVGGGLAGILCAYRMAQEGVDYALIESDRICRGVTRNTTAKITSQHGLIYSKLLSKFGGETTKGYWEANEQALKTFASLSERIPCDFERKSNYIFAIGSDKKLQKEMEALQALGIPAAFTKHVPLPVQTAGAVCFPNQAQFEPLKFVSEIAAGLRIYEKTAAREFIGNTVLTDKAKIQAEKIIIATHFPILNKHGGYSLKLYQQRSYVLALENAPLEDGMYLDAAENGLSFRSSGKFLLLGGGGHRTGKKGGCWPELETFAQACYPQATEKFRWATQDCITLDGLPYIGQYSKNTPDLYVATGFNKWGMTTSMVSAMILSDLVQGRENPYQSIFDPSRSILHPQLLTNGIGAAVNLLTPTTPRCPHLGCALKWNSQEHTWDCPCHGSRFTEEGKLLDNPATGDLP